MSELKIRKRQRLRKKEIKKISEGLNQSLGAEILKGNEVIEKGELDRLEILLINNELLGLVVNENPFLTVKGLLKYKPSKKYVTVDMGAVKFVCDGADVMVPGIVDIDPEIKKDELVWVRDERHKKPLAVGIALMSAAEILKSEKGKAVKTINYVGDKLWQL